MEPSQEILPPVISIGSPYYFSSILDSTARAAQIPLATLLDSRKSNYLLDIIPTMPQPPPTIFLHKQTFSVSSSRGRRIESRESLSVTEEPAIPKVVQWQLCGDEFHTFNAPAPTARRLFQWSKEATSGNISADTRSRPPTDLSSAQLYQLLDSSRHTLMRAPSARGEPWIY